VPFFVLKHMHPCWKEKTVLGMRTCVRGACMRASVYLWLWPCRVPRRGCGRVGSWGGVDVIEPMSMPVHVYPCSIHVSVIMSVQKGGAEVTLKMNADGLNILSVGKQV